MLGRKSLCSLWVGLLLAFGSSNFADGAPQSETQLKLSPPLQEAVKIQKSIKSLDDYPEDVSDERIESEVKSGLVKCEEALQLDPNSVDGLLLRAFFNRRYQSLIDSQAQAVRNLQGADLVLPKDAQARLERTKSRSNEQAAKADLLKAVELAPARLDASYELYRLYEQLYEKHARAEDRKLADQYAEKAYQLRAAERKKLSAPIASDAVFTELAYRTKRWEEAAKLCEQLMEAQRAKTKIEDLNFLPEEYLLRSLFRSGQIERGRKELARQGIDVHEEMVRKYESLNPKLTADQLLALANQNVAGFRLGSTTLSDLVQFDHEIELLTRAIALAPQRGDLLFERGRRSMKRTTIAGKARDELVVQADAAKAIADFASAEKLGEKRAELFSLRAEAHHLRKEYAEALAAYEKVWEAKTPSEESVLRRTLEAAAEVKNYDKSLGFLERFIKAKEEEHARAVKAGVIGSRGASFELKEERISLLEKLGRERDAVAAALTIYTSANLILGSKHRKRVEELFVRSATPEEQAEFKRRGGGAKTESAAMKESPEAPASTKPNVPAPPVLTEQEFQKIYNQAIRQRKMEDARPHVLKLEELAKAGNMSARDWLKRLADAGESGHPYAELYRETWNRVKDLPPPESQPRKKR